jgi:ferredoxin
MTVQVEVDPDLCIGSGNCVHLAPKAFELDEDGIAAPTETAAVSEDQLRLAARSCPTGAIRVND